MPKPILKRAHVKFKPASLEEFSISPQSIIPADSVREDEPQTGPVRPKHIPVIRKQNVQKIPKQVDIFVKGVRDEMPLPSNTKEEIPEVLESHRQVTYSEEQLEELQNQWQKEWDLKLEISVEEARKESFEEGYNKAKEDLEEEVEKQKEQLAEGLRRLKDNWESFIQRSETQLLEIALEVTKFIIDAPLPNQLSNATHQILSETLETLSRETPITISLNPLDLLRFQEAGIMQLIKDQFPGLRWDPQPTLSEGNWIIQTPRKAIRRISDELLTNLKSQFGLLEQTSSDLEITSSQPGIDVEYLPPVNHVAVSTTPAPRSIEESQLKNLAFSPASSTANNPLNDFQNLQNRTDTDS